MKPSFRWMLERPGFGICVKCLTEKPESEMQYPGKCRVCNRAWYRTWSHKKYGPPRTKLTDEELAARAAARQTARSKTGWTREEHDAWRSARRSIFDITKGAWFFKVSTGNGIGKFRPIDEQPKKFYSAKKSFDTEFERDEYVRGWREYREWCAENHEAIKRAAQDRKNTARLTKARERGVTAMEERKARAIKTKRERQRWKDIKKRKLGIAGKRLPWDFEEKLLESQSGCCFYCKVEVGDEFHLDHVFPIAKGGTHTPDNLVIACPACNTSKRDLMPWEFKVAA